MILYHDYHYDGDCGVAKFLMRLSGRAFNAFELAEIPQGYVENGDFGSRVAKYDWFELLAKFPLLIVLLVIAGLTMLFWLFWLCCSVRGLQKSTKKRHRCCLYFSTFLLLVLLLPLAIGLYLTFRTNFLLRRTKDDSKSFGDTARSALDDENANFMNQAEYEANPTQISIEINKVITDEFADWQQTIAQIEQTNFENLNYLYSNGDFYSTALQSLRDYAYELVILGIEMDDLLRTVVREAFAFLQANVKNASLTETKMLQRERINVWHLSTVYMQYLQSHEYLEYLLKAYENISLLQKSIAESTLRADISEDDLFVTPTVRELPKSYMNDRSSSEHPQILNPILYLAMAMFFVTAALAYILLMALGFGICRYYARANCMLKIFLFLNLLTIPVLAFLTVLHFLPAMVLHTGICHEDDLRGSIAESRRCDPVNNIVANGAYDYENAELSSTQQMRDNILPKVERMLPKIKTNHENYTSNHQVVVEFPQEREWYESDVQVLITNENYTSYAGYINEYTKKNTTGADIFSCKLNSIPNAVRTDLYDKAFVPSATELYEVLSKLNRRAQSTDYENFTKLLESAQSELVVFEKLYALSKDNFLAALSAKLDKKLRENSKTLENRSVACYRGHTSSSAMNGTSKCGCLENLLMLYAIGSALLVFTLFFTMLLSLLLYKLYKRGPPIFACPQPPKPDECLRAPIAVSGSPCKPTAGTAAQSTIDGRDCTLSQTGVNCSVAHTGTPLINTVNFIPPLMGAFGCQQYPPMISPTNCQQSSPQMYAGTCQRNPPQVCAGTSQRNPPQMRETSCQRSTTQMCGTSCQRSSTHMCSSSRKDSVILPLQCRSRTQTNCVGAEAQLVGGGRTNDKTVTVMVFQGPKDRQPLVTYPPPPKLEKK